MAAWTVTVDRYDEQIVPGHRLGRHRSRDSRSAAYPYRPPALPRLVPITSVLHERHAPILDQADLRSCVGNADVGAAATSPLYEALPAGHPVLDENEAVALYEAATRLDTVPGAYPPDDTGTDSTSGAQATKNAGLISGYTHAATLADVLQALLSGPVLLGIDWWSSFDEPDRDGYVTIAARAAVRGGHEILARGIDAERKWILCDNSWGTGWGNGGSFAFSWDTFTRLLTDGGDAIVPLPATAPAPVPVPVPVTRDQAFATDPKMVTWARRLPSTYAKRAWQTWAGGVS